MLDDAEDSQSINSMASSFQRFANIFTLYKFISSIFIEFKGNNLILEESTDYTKNYTKISIGEFLIINL